MSPAELTGRYEACTDLSEDDRQLLERIAVNLGLLTDLTHADAVLFPGVGNGLAVVAPAQPVPVPSPHAQPLAAETLSREEAPGVYRVLHDPRGRNYVTTAVIRGAPV